MFLLWGVWGCACRHTREARVWWVCASAGNYYRRTEARGESLMTEVREVVEEPI